MRILLRTIVLMALFVGQLLAWRLADGDDGGANIGAGLIAFGVTVLVSAVWAGLDASRRPTAAVLREWAAVALAFGLANSFLPQWGEDGIDWSVWRSDLAFLAVFDFFLVFGPAMISALVVAGSREQSPTP